MAVTVVTVMLTPGTVEKKAVATEKATHKLAAEVRSTTAAQLEEQKTAFDEERSEMQVENQSLKRGLIEQEKELERGRWAR